MADSVVGRLRALLALDDKEFKRGLASAEGLAKKSATNLSRTFGAALGGLGAGIATRAILRATIEQENASRKLAQAIQTTGRAGRTSAADIEAFASSLQRTTTFADEAITDLVARLLAFKNIPDQLIKPTTQAILDLAATGKPIGSAFKSIAAAMNDPVRGMNRLAQAGVALDPAIRATIKSLAEQGRTLEAQKMLLDAVNGSVGGMAAAMRGTLGGALTGLKNQFGELLEQDSLGGTTAAVNELADALARPEMRRAADELGVALAAGLTEAAGAATFLAENIELTRLALFGLVGLQVAGPLGAVAGIFFGLTTQTSELAKASDLARTATDNLAKAEGAAIGPARNLAEERLKAAKATLASARAELAQGGLVNSNVVQNTVGNLFPGLPGSLGEIDQLGKEIAALEAELAKVPKAASPAAASLEDVGTAAGLVSKETAKAREKIDDTIRSMAVELAGLRRMEAAQQQGAGAVAQLTRALAIEKAILDLGADATDDHRRAVAALEGAKYDAALATDAFTKAEEQATRATERAADDAARDAERAAEDQARLLTEPFRAAAEDIQQTLTDAIVGALDGSLDSAKDVADELERVFIRAAANIASAFVFQPLIGGLAGGMGIPFGAAAGATPAGGGLGGLATGTGQWLASGLASAGIFTSDMQGPMQPGNSRIGLSSGQLGNLAGGALTGLGILGLDAAAGNLSRSLGTTVSTIMGTLAGVVGSIWGGPGAVGLGNTVGKMLGPSADNVMGFMRDKLGLGEGGALALSLLTITNPLELFLSGLVMKPDKQPIQLATNATAGGPFYGGVSAESPFGFVGLSQKSDFRDSGIPIAEEVAALVAKFDKEIVRILDEDLIGGVAEALQSYEPHLTGNLDKPKTQIPRLLVDRLVAIVDAVTGDVGAGFDAIGFAEGEALNREETQQALQAGAAWLEARGQLVDLIDELRGFGEPVSEVEKEFEAIKELFEQITAGAEKFHIGFADAEAARQAAEQRVRTGFLTGISDQILAMVNPVELALRQQQRQAEERLRNATDLGLELVEVERLNAMERKRILEDANRPIDDFLRGISAQFTDPSAVYGDVRSRFLGLASEKAAGGAVGLDVLLQASRELLDASRTMNASGEKFFADLTLVEGVLQAARTNLPGFATGGSFKIPGAGLDNVVPLFRVSGGESVSVSRQDPYAAMGGMAQQQAETNAELRSLNKNLSARIDALTEIVERQQAEIMRLARRKVA